MDSTTKYGHEEISTLKVRFCKCVHTIHMELGLHLLANNKVMPVKKREEIAALTAHKQHNGKMNYESILHLSYFHIESINADFNKV